MSSTQSSPYSVVSSLPSSPEPISIDQKAVSLSCSAEAGQEPQDHPYFSFYDQNVTFLVENTLFTVHRYYFYRDSDIFRQMFLLPPPQGQVVEGMSRENPIRLLGVSALDFERFLKVLYPPEIGVDPLSTPSEWMSVLDIADKFNFTTVRELAIRRLLDRAAPIDKVILGHRYGERRLLIPGYRDLCSRYNSLTLEEGLRLGMEDVILIQQTREQIRDTDYIHSADFDVEHYFKCRLPYEPEPA